MLDQVEHLLEGVSWTAVALGLVVAWYAYRHGLPWVWAKVTSIWNSSKEGVQRLENLIHISAEDLHVRVDELVARVQALESKPAPVPMPAPAPMPVHTAPAPVPVPMPAPAPVAPPVVPLPPPGTATFPMTNPAVVATK